mgnify:FL=1
MQLLVRLLAGDEHALLQGAHKFVRIGPVYAVVVVQEAERREQSGHEEVQRAVQLLHEPQCCTADDQAQRQHHGNRDGACPALHVIQYGVAEQRAHRVVDGPDQGVAVEAANQCGRQTEVGDQADIAGKRGEGDTRFMRCTTRLVTKIWVNSVSALFTAMSTARNAVSVSPK